MAKVPTLVSGTHGRDVLPATRIIYVKGTYRESRLNVLCGFSGDIVDEAADLIIQIIGILISALNNSSCRRSTTPTW
jgi:hypothetical protein